MENVNFCVCLISSDTNVSAYKSWASFKPYLQFVNLFLSFLMM
jgi:hypothetical protein